MVDPGAVIQMVTAVAAFGSAGIAYWSKHHAKRSAEVSRTIEDAVNHRHRHTTADGGSPPRLFDIALENRDSLAELKEWKNSYSDPDGGQGLLDTGEKVADFVENNERVHQTLLEDVAELKLTVDAYIEERRTNE